MPVRFKTGICLWPIPRVFVHANLALLTFKNIAPSQFGLVKRLIGIL